MSTETTNQRGLFATVVEAAEYLGISRATIYAEMDRGRLGYTKVAGARRVLWSELDRYVAANTTQASA